MSSDTRRHRISSAPSYPGYQDNSSAWEERYRQRARAMTRDYVNPNSTRLHQQQRPMRSRSADAARPQYRTASRRAVQEFPEIRATSSADLSSSHRSQQAFNMFYPTTDESIARVTYDSTGPQYPSQLPKPVGFYKTEFERTGRSLSPPSYRGTGGGVARTPPGMVDPYESLRYTSPIMQTTSKPPSYPSAAGAPRQQNANDYLIMFGEEESSFGTGLSQQELLQKKRRDQTNERRKSKKQRKRIVNLPSSLFPPHSSRQLQQNSSRRNNDDYPIGLPRESAASPVTVEQYEPPSPSIATRGWNPAPPISHDPQSNSASRGRSMNTRSVSPDPSPEPGYDTAPKSAPETRGWRNSMVNRIRNQKSSTSRRWKIIPSLSKSRSRSPSPSRDHSQDSIGAFPSPPRQAVSARYGYPSNPTTTRIPHGEMDISNEESMEDGNTSYKLDPPMRGRQLDPPSRLPPRHDYSSGEEDDSAQLDTGFEEHFPSSGDMSREQYEDFDEMQPSGGTIPQGSGGGTQSAVRHVPVYSKRMGIRDDSVEEANVMQPTPRTHPESSRTKYPRRKDGAFPDFTSPITPMTASMSMSSSSDIPSYDDASRLASGYTTNETGDRHQMEFLTPEPRKSRPENPRRGPDHLLTAQPPRATSFREEMNFRSEARTNVRAAYMPSSLLNNPPGLDMDYYAPKKPDAPGSASGAPDYIEDYDGHRVSKISPTSVADFPNSNVRWSDELHQLPTPRRITSERPKSILRSGRIRQRGGVDYASEGTHAKTVRISVQPESRSQFISENPREMVFVDKDGHELSPINSFDAEDGNLPAGNSTSIFERNIPEEFQRAFLVENAVSKTDSESGQISAAYSDFIESVASVVVQTAARQFLAKLKVRKLQEERRGTFRRSEQRRMQRAVEVGKRHIRSNISTRNAAGRNLDMFYLAATQIQATFRGWYARDCIAVDNYCARIIQTAFRNYCGRKEFSFLRRCVTKLQALARGKQAYDAFATSMYCVVAIQAAYRGYHVRKMIASTVYEEHSEMIEHDAATLIQAQWRCFKCEMAFLRAYEDILLVQSVVRGWVTRRILRSWIRASNIQTSVLQEKRRTRQLKLQSPESPYKLPNDYHHHTAFLKQSIPSPVNNTYKTSHLERGSDEKAETTHKFSGAPRTPEKSNGRVSIYQRQREQMNKHNAMTRREAEVTTYPKDKDLSLQGHSRSTLKQPEAQWKKAGTAVTKSTVDSHRIPAGNAQNRLDANTNGTSGAGVKAQGRTQPIWKGSTPRLVELYTAQRDTSFTQDEHNRDEVEVKTSRENRNSLQEASGSVKQPAEVSRKKSDVAVRISSFESHRGGVESTQTPKAEVNVRASWASGNNQRKPQSTWQASTNRSSTVATAEPLLSDQQTGEMNAATGGSLADGGGSNLSIRARMAAFEQPQRKISKTLSRDETIGGQKGREFRVSGSKNQTPVVGQPGSTEEFWADLRSNGQIRESISFDAVHLRQAPTDSPATMIVNAAAVSDSLPDNTNAVAASPDADPKKTSGASSVLASWRDREKKMVNASEGTPAAVSDRPNNVQSRGSIKSPSWVKREEGEERGATDVDTSKTVDGAEKIPPQARSSGRAVPASWQKNRLNRNHVMDETFSSTGGDNDEKAQPRQSEVAVDQERKLRLVNSDLHDEKKDDSVRPSEADYFAASPEPQPLHERSLSKGRPQPFQNALTVGPSGSVAPVKAAFSADSSLPADKSLQDRSPVIEEAGDPLKSKSPLHMEMRQRRSDSENERIDSMHRMFIRAGLLGRKPKETISFAHTTSAEYEGMKLEAEHQNGRYG